MKELADFEPTEEQFGIFWKYIQDENVTDVDYNGREIWITDLVRGHYKAEEKPDEKFLVQFTHMVANCVNRQFNQGTSYQYFTQVCFHRRNQYLYPQISSGGAEYDRGSVRERILSERDTGTSDELYQGGSEYRSRWGTGTW